MWFRFSYFTCDGSSTIWVSSLLFKIGMVNQKPRVLFQMGEGNAAIHSVGGLLIVGVAVR
jgi:hypothetical protein